MSDYLTRLIERSLGAAPQIGPLIAPLHAPPQQILSEETGTIAPSPAKIESSERSAAPGNPANGKTSEAASSKFESHRFQDSHLLSESPAGFPIDPSVGPSDPGESRQASSPPAPDALDPSSVPFSPPMVSQEGTRVVVEPEIIARPGSGAAPEEPPPLPNGKSRIAVQPEIIVHRNPPKAAGVPTQPSANEPPAIHVTIGRVEVRAVMSPSAPPKVAPRAAPKLSLQDYLKQRNGGAR